MSVAWPQVVTSLVSLLSNASAFTGWTIYDQETVSRAAPANSVTVGYSEGGSAGSFTQNPSPYSNHGAAESGVVNCLLRVTTGSVDLPAKRAAVFTAFDAWSDALFADHMLSGVLSVDSSVSITADVDAMQFRGGSAVHLPVQIRYTTTTFS